MKKNAYTEAAKKALLKQNKMTEEEIDLFIKDAYDYKDIEEVANIETYMWAAMSKILDLTHANGTALMQFAGQILVSDYAYEDEISYDDINRLWKSEVKNNNLAIMDILESMHNDLFVLNGAYVIAIEKRNQEVPFNQAGWEKVAEYLSYLSPILDRIGVSFDENQLKQEYEKLSPKFNNKQRLYGKYEPISEETKKVIDDLYSKFSGSTELKHRFIAYDNTKNQEIINQDLLFAGATAINEAYMLRNTHQVELPNGKKIKSLKLRDFKDDQVEDELKTLLADNLVKVEVVAKDIVDKDIDKRKNFELDNSVLYRVKEGKYKDLCFSTGLKTNKDGSKQDALFIDIANTPFDKLTKGWQESNFDPFEFAYKLVSHYPTLSDEDYAAVIHVYWLASNQWAIEYKDPMAVPYKELDKVEQVKDGDNVLVANVFKKEEEKVGADNLNKEKCLDIVKIAKDMLGQKLENEAKDVKTAE